MDVRTDVVQTRRREGIVMPFRSNTASELVLDVIYEIFQHLNVGEICHARMVCKAWSKVDWNEPRLLKVLKKLGMVFGKEEWNDHFGDVGEALRLPPDIGKILLTPSIGVEGYGGKRVWDSHLLTLIPAKVDGKPFSIDLLINLFHSPKQGYRAEFRSYLDSRNYPLCSSWNSESQWSLMTRSVLVESRSKSFEAQVELVELYAKEMGLTFCVPNTLHAATSILMHDLKNGEKLYSYNPGTYTRCQEKSYEGYWFVVGGFFNSELSLVCRISDNNSYGMAAVLKI